MMINNDNYDNLDNFFAYVGNCRLRSPSASEKLSLVVLVVIVVV